MTTQTPHHLEESLQRDMDQIQAKVLEMARLDETALRNAFNALLEKDLQLAYSVILRDQHIDELEGELDKLCLQFIVRHQPVAGHLRFIYASIQINRILERIGDYAENIARKALLLASMEPQPRYDKFVKLSNLSVEMLQASVQAYMERDTELAKKSMDIETTADQIRYRINMDLLNLSRNEIFPLKLITPLMTVARCFERVTDQAKNICEEVFYMATGETIKHKGSDTFRILFVDETNSCLSQMAEGIGKSLGLSKIVFESAGLKQGTIDKNTAQFMSSKGIDISKQVPRLISQIPDYDNTEVVVTFSRRIQAKIPRTSSKTVKIEWHVLNPSRHRIKKGTYTDYEKAYSYLNTHIKDLVQAILGEKQGEAVGEPS